MESSQSVGAMECNFSEEVQYIQLDFYVSGSTDPPGNLSFIPILDDDGDEIAVSCDQTFCDPNAIFADMLEVRNLSKQLLTLEVHGVSQAHAGNYRCQAQSIASTRTVDGICSIRYPIPAQEITTESPAAKKESDILYYVLLVLLVLPIAATVILLLCICKRKSLGPWKKQDSVLDDTVGPAVGAGPRLSYPEAQPLVTLTNEGVADRSLPAGQSGDGEGNARDEESRIILDDGKDTADSERQSVDVIANNRDDADVGDVSHVHRSGSDVIRLPTCETNEDNVDISLNAVRRQFQ
ncbi:hypothetical protein C0Q70_15032 [Pomacea canaliculata]|uniref:Ig-like domain-containing protein n=1 Tax=Pomacea canaliculata TaxID=400727 RepID=A0A2T7NTP9_POMCA|nr:hypothetical protein C0Q70_15032 [Pomacea canaliculata]